MGRRSILVSALLLATLLSRSAHADDAADVPADAPAPSPPSPDVPAPTPTPPDAPGLAPVLAPTPAPVPVHGGDPDHHNPPLGLLPSPADALIDPRMARSWGARPPRWFAATTVDIGFVYTRPRLSLGYGQPFTSWAGIDANPLVNANGLGAYGGLRLEFPYVDLRFGARYFGSFNRTYLAPQPSFDRLALETQSGDLARFTTIESELDVSLPAGPGNILGRASGSYVVGVPDGMYVFEETLRVIVKPPWVVRLRGGYAFRFGAYSQHSIAAVVDLLDVPERDEYRTIRVGPIIRLVLSRRVELRGSFVASIISPDRIGLRGGDFTELGVRYRWASE